MSSQVPLWALWIPFISTVIGGLVTGVVTYLINRTNKKAEDRKHKRELIVKIALEEHAKGWEYAMKYGAVVPPIEMFIVHKNSLIDAMLSDDPLSEERLIEILDRSKKIIDAHTSHVQPKTSEEKP